ncbi:DUF2158 domain-containing protein [Dongia sp.]|uniref:DUF2158 domain-containing protein n=1 Tax=Dongia sp. TaxID=1977262 RepID=UPI0037527242
MADAFKPGDLVRLKSGGPVMTVDQLVGDDGLQAMWFAYGHQISRYFGSQSVEAAPGPDGGIVAAKPRMRRGGGE